MNYLVKIIDLEARYRAAQRVVKAETTALAEAQATAATAREVHAIFQEASTQTQRLAHSRIAAVASRCLSAVFDDPYDFRLVFESKRNRTEVRLVFTRGGVDLDDPVDSCGGGVVDVAAFALRLACLMLMHPPRRRLLVLDEPFKHLSREYRPRVAALLQTLTREMGVQIIMVTHDPALCMGRVVEIKKEG